MNRLKASTPSQIQVLLFKKHSNFFFSYFRVPEWYSNILGVTEAPRSQMNPSKPQLNQMAQEFTPHSMAKKQQVWNYRNPTKNLNLKWTFYYKDFSGPCSYASTAAACSGGSSGLRSKWFFRKSTSSAPRIVHKLNNERMYINLLLMKIWI